MASFEPKQLASSDRNDWHKSNRSIQLISNVKHGLIFLELMEMNSYHYIELKMADQIYT